MGFPQEALMLHEKNVVFSKRNLVQLYLSENIYKKKETLDIYERKLKTEVRMTCLNFICMSVFYEFNENYERGFEALKYILTKKHVKYNFIKIRKLVSR